MKSNKSNLPDSFGEHITAEEARIESRFLFEASFYDAIKEDIWTLEEVVISFPFFSQKLAAGAPDVPSVKFFNLEEQGLEGACVMVYGAVDASLDSGGRKKLFVKIVDDPDQLLTRAEVSVDRKNMSFVGGVLELSASEGMNIRLELPDKRVILFRPE